MPISNKKNMSKREIIFKAYIDVVKDDKVRLNDAYLRLGDQPICFRQILACHGCLQQSHGNEKHRCRLCSISKSN